MSAKPSFFAELKRRNVLRAATLYAAGAWALAQSIAQLLPVFGAPEWITRWIVIAEIIGFPFWVALAWFYELTPDGLKRESEIDPCDSSVLNRGRKLDFWIIGILGVAVVLLLTDHFVAHKDNGANIADIPSKSIAVLPLTNDSGDKDQQFFSDGLSEDLITALSQFAGLKVIGRNSAFQFRNTNESSASIGAKLGVAHLMEGSVRRVGETVRISAELIKAADGSTLWSQHYDRPYKDLFALQDDITRAVASALEAKLLPNAGAAAQSERPESGNLDAYNAYLQGKFYSAQFTEAGERRATEQFTEATRLDPRYAAAYSALSSAWTSLAAFFLDRDSLHETYAAARTANDTALTLDPSLAIAHVARGGLLLYADFDWKGAEDEYQRALQLEPNQANALVGLGQLRAVRGQAEQAIAPTRRALASDPLHASWYHALGAYLIAVGRLDEAEAVTRKSIDLQPSSSSRYEQLVIISILRGDAKAALQAAQQEPPGVWRQIAFALAQQISGDQAAADAALDTLIAQQEDSSALQIADTYALRRDPDKVFEWLDRAWANRDPGISAVLYDPFFQRFYDDPRFGAFCRKIGLPDPRTAPTALRRAGEGAPLASASAPG